MNAWRRLRKRLGGGPIFFLATLAFTFLLWLARPAAVARAVPFFLAILRQIWPVLLIVFALLFAVNLLVSPAAVKRWLGRESRARGWLVAVAGGILSSGPIYLWYPLLAELREHGMRTALAATFLYNRAIKPALLPLLVYYFGPGFTLVLTVLMIVFSMVQGVLVERIVDRGRPAP